MHHENCSFQLVKCPASVLSWSRCSTETVVSPQGLWNHLITEQCAGPLRKLSPTLSGQAHFSLGKGQYSSMERYLRIKRQDLMTEFLPHLFYYEEGKYILKMFFLQVYRCEQDFVIIPRTYLPPEERQQLSISLTVTGALSSRLTLSIQGGLNSHAASLSEVMASGNILVLSDSQVAKMASEDSVFKVLYTIIKLEDEESSSGLCTPDDGATHPVLGVGNGARGEEIDPEATTEDEVDLAARESAPPSPSILEDDL